MRVGTPHIVWRRVGEWHDVQQTCGYFFRWTFLLLIYILSIAELDLRRCGKIVCSNLMHTGNVWRSGIKYVHLICRLTSLLLELRITHCDVATNLLIYFVQNFRNTFNAVNLNESWTRACLRSSYVYILCFISPPNRPVKLFIPFKALLIPQPLCWQFLSF